MRLDHLLSRENPRRFRMESGSIKKALGRSSPGESLKESLCKSGMGISQVERLSKGAATSGDGLVASE